MGNFSQISGALKYIDSHLDEPINLDTLSEKFYFSPFYFHRLFSAIVGKSLAAFIRDRRILSACDQLWSTEKTILDIALGCGFQSSQSFSRAFKASQGLSPTQYRQNGCRPVVITAEELIRKFTNRLRGGIDLNPTVIKREPMLIAGTFGPGDETRQVWRSFEALCRQKPLCNALSKNGYEIRTYGSMGHQVHVGYPVTDKNVDPAYTIFELPASKYACFDVYVASGYTSETSAMNEWLDSNTEGYCEKLLDGDAHYCVEYYDHRFHDDAADSIVEIWIPIEKK